MCNGCTLCIRGKTSKDWRALMKTVDVVIATPSMMGESKSASYVFRNRIDYCQCLTIRLTTRTSRPWPRQVKFARKVRVGNIIEGFSHI